MEDAENKKPFKVKDVTRNIKKAVVAATLEEIRSKVAEKFEKNELLPTIHLDSDGTEIDDEEYFRTLDANTELIAVFPGEHWIDPSHYVTITTSHRDSADTTDAAAETARIKQLVGQLQNNLCNVSVMNDADLDSLSNMDPNSLVDITGKDFMEQLKDSGRPLCAKRNAQDRINLLKLLRDGAIFCSERYPEEAEAIDMEISRQLSIEITKANATKDGDDDDNDVDDDDANAATKNNTDNNTTTTTKTIEQVQNAATTADGSRNARILLNEAQMNANNNAANIANVAATTNTKTTTTTTTNDI